jgi:hypothetical protein
MPETPLPDERLQVELRDPFVAGVLAWLVPGLGHLYQRRYAKGVLFLVCVLGTYFFGLAIGEGKVVYASWNQTDHRWQFAFQAPMGVVVAPAILQTLRVRGGQEPLWNGFMAPPRFPPELSEWHLNLNQRFEMGSLYTMIAGLLNIFAIYDAYGGPAPPPAPPKKKSKDDKDPDDANGVTSEKKESK